MADPLLRLVAAPGASPGATPPPRLRPLLNPQQATDMVTGAGKPAGAPSLWDQVSGMVTGLPGGLIGMGGEALKSAAGLPRLAFDVGANVAQGRAPGEGFSRDYGSNLGEYFPLLESFRQSGVHTAYRVSHPGEYVQAAQEGRIVPAIVEDAANLSIVAGPAAKLAGAGAGAAAVEGGADAAVAEQAGARAGAEITAKAGARAGARAAGADGARIGADAAAPTGAQAGAEGAAQATGRFQPRFLTPQRFPLPSTLDAATAARPRLLQAGQAIERLARPAEEVANAPARIWSAPFKLARGVELPEVFGRTAEGAPRQFGLKPVLDRTGITEKVMANPTVADYSERLGDWQHARRLNADLRSGALTPAQAKVQIAAHQLDRELRPARRILDDNPDLMTANHLIHTGGQALVEIIPRLRAQVQDIVREHPDVGDPEALVRQVIAETWGMRQAPSEAAMGHVLDYVNGSMDPALRGRFDTAWEFESRALKDLEDEKLQREMLHPEQLGIEPMQHRVDAITGRTAERIQELKDEIEGTTSPTGEYTPGLRAKVAQAQAAIPEADPARLVGARTQAAARRAGATEQEAAFAGRRAESLARQAETARARQERAAGGTLAGTRAELAQLEAERYGFGPDRPEWAGREWARRQLEIGREERAGGPSAVPRTVPDDEFALRERLARLEGEGRTAGLEQQLPRTAGAQERNVGAQQRAAEAKGRLFTEGAQPVFQAPPQLGFGVSEADRRMFEAPPPPEAPVTPEHRAEAVQARDELAQAGEQAKITLSDRLVGTGASLREDGTPTIGHIPDYYREHVETLMEQQAPGARSAAQREALRRRRRFGDRPAELGFIETLPDDEWKMLKRHMREADPNDIAAPDQWATELANTEGRSRDEVSTDMATEAMLTGLKQWENAQDLAHGVKPRWPDELDNTIELSPADRAMAEALPDRGRGQVAPRKVPDAAAEAMVRARREGLADEHHAAMEQALPDARLGPSPWTMDREAFHNELNVIDDALAPVAGVPVEQWTPEQVQAEQRLLELEPESLGDVSALSHDEIYDRVHEAAQLAGREVAGGPKLTAAETPEARLAAAGEAGRAPVRDAEAIAQEAVLSDEGLREFWAEHGEPPNTQSLARTHLSRAEQKIYDAITSGERAGVATERLGETRQKLTAGIRAEGEVAGQRVGEAQGAAQVYERQAEAAGQRAETLAPKVEAADERARQVAEQEVQRPVNFGERRGKRIRDVQNQQRLLRTREGQLRWLEDEVLPRQQAELAQGPREVAPGRYAPALMTGERLHDSLQRMGNDLAVQTGDPWMSGAFWDLMSDVPRTMAELHARGIYPEYLPGAVDEPTRGARTMAGGQMQLPWERDAAFQRRKRYGHVPQTIRTVHRSMVNDVQVMVERDTAHLVRDKWARTGTDIVDELVQAGELTPRDAAILTGPNRDRSVDFAKEMEDHGYGAWDPEKPQLPSDRNAGPDSYYLPAPLLKSYQRWWKPTNTHGAVRVYDQMTRGFKHAVLAMSPSWQVNNILGNAFMAVVFGGESPAAVFRATRDVLRQMREGGAEQRQLFPTPEAAGRLSRTGRAVVNRVRPLRAAREWGRDIAAAPAIGPARLYGAGSSAEIRRGFAEMTEPRTMFGRGLQTAYRVNETVDNVGRTALYMLKRAKGYNDEEAVGMALNALGDFNNMSRFERDVVRRIIPFYAWMRHVTQASLHLAVDHPWRTAWLLHVSDMFNPGGQDTGMPDYLKSGLGVGGGWYIPFGGANPLQGNAGSLFTSPKQWPAELMRSLNPNIKLAATLGGLNLSQARTTTRPPGTGPLDVYGKPAWGPPSPNEFAYMALRQVPQGRLFTDLVYNPGANEVLPEPVLRYDTGQVIKRQRRPIPQTGGRLGGVVRNLGIPFFPTYVDEAQLRARIAKGQAAARKAEATYNR